MFRFCENIYVANIKGEVFVSFPYYVSMINDGDTLFSIAVEVSLGATIAIKATAADGVGIALREFTKNGTTGVIEERCAHPVEPKGKEDLCLSTFPYYAQLSYGTVNNGKAAVLVADGMVIVVAGHKIVMDTRGLPSSPNGLPGVTFEWVSRSGGQSFATAGTSVDHYDASSSSSGSGSSSSSSSREQPENGVLVGSTNMVVGTVLIVAVCLTVVLTAVRMVQKRK